MQSQTQTTNLSTPASSSPVVSIIVPIYNAAEQLQRCIDSILNQEYRNFELLLADDGSTDGSAAICDAYAEKDARVRVFHKQNSGVSDTRNQAMRRARGTYLQFVDSDDWITPEATKLFVRTAESYDCDLVIADFYRVSGKAVSHKGDITKQQVLSRQEYASCMMKNPADFYYGVLWNKLFRRSLIERWQLQMDVRLHWCEDFIFNLEYILHAERFFALTVPVYYYVRTKGSLVNKQMNPIAILRMKRMVFEYYNHFYKEVFDEKEYEKKRPQIYQFLVDAAGDGFVPPSFLPGSHRLGKERDDVSANAIRGEGVLLGAYRDQKLFEHYLEVSAIKNDLSMAEMKILFLLLREKRLLDTTGREIMELTGLQQSAFALALQKLSLKNMVQVKALSEAGEATTVRDINLPLLTNPDRPLLLEALPAFLEQSQLLQDLHDVENDYENARFAGFTEEEFAQYEALTRRIKQNIEAILLPEAQLSRAEQKPQAEQVKTEQEMKAEQVNAAFPGATKPVPRS